MALRLLSLLLVFGVYSCGNDNMPSEAKAASSREQINTLTSATTITLRQDLSLPFSQAPYQAAAPTLGFVNGQPVANSEPDEDSCSLTITLISSAVEGSAVNDGEFLNAMHANRYRDYILRPSTFPVRIGSVIYQGEHPSFEPRMTGVKIDFAPDSTPLGRGGVRLTAADGQPTFASLLGMTCFSRSGIDEDWIARVLGARLEFTH